VSGPSLSKLHDHTQTLHTRYDSSGRVISSSQRPLPHKTRYSQQTSTPTVGFEPTISAGDRPKTSTLDRAATGTREEEKLLIRNIIRLFRITSLYTVLAVSHISTYIHSRCTVPWRYFTTHSILPACKNCNALKCVCFCRLAYVMQIVQVTGRPPFIDLYIR
jgi:hypothetical protein